MALRSTQPLTGMGATCISWGKGGRCVRLTTLPPSCAIFMKSGNLNFLEPSGPLQACNRTALPIIRKFGIKIGLHKIRHQSSTFLTYLLTPWSRVLPEKLTDS